MHAMRRSMHSALDKAADKCAAKFVSERLPPLWLQGSDRMHSNVAKVAQVDLRAAYDEGAGEGVAAELRCDYVIPTLYILYHLDSSFRLHTHRRTTK